MTTSPSFAVLLQTFFTEHLVAHRRVSPRTLASYRDTFRLLLKFFQETAGISPASLCTADLDAPAILSFLDDLENNRGNSVRSRNVRLAAIRSFFRFVIFRDPESAAVATRVLAIPVKRAEHRLVGYLTRSEIQAILASPDRSKWSGRRDHALLLTLYNTGARVSEITALKRSQISFDNCSFLHLHGKGRKDREVPLWANTVHILKAWLHENHSAPDDIVFPNARGGSLSSDGVSYILRQAVTRATGNCSNLASKRITPHMIRHTTAMHLLQSGVDLSVIALWLGHESVETTHVYVEADLASKERALEKLNPPEESTDRFKADNELIAFLAAL